jgi:predicted AlkP superfamily phosphohydrolase/phosphomutase
MKTLLIGLDGGTWDLLGPLCDLGIMPKLAALRARGAWSPLRSTQPPFTAPAWARFITGVNPGKHGILNFVQHDGTPAGSLRGQGRPVNSTDIGAPLLWDYFSAHARDVGCINLPLSYPLRPMKGFAISGMLTPPAGQDWIYPRSLAKTLNDYIIDLEYGRAGQPLRREDLPSPLGMIHDIMRMTERRGMHSVRFMQTQPWDVFMVVFTGTDRLSHHFWHYLQPGAATRNMNPRIADKLQAYFALLDQILGMMVAMAGPETHLLMLSDHGFGRAARHWVHLNNWLLELDLMRLRMGKASWMNRVKRSAPWLTDLTKRILPPEARKSVQQHGHLADAVDWDETLAWAAPLYNNVAGITLHRTTHSTPGPVSPAAVPKVREFIIQQAKLLRIPGKNRPLFTAVQTREEVYSGPYVEQFPDIILTLGHDYAAVPTLGSSLITQIPPGTLLRSGDHRPNGMFLAAGPHIKPGRLPQPPSLMDLAPTTLHLSGLPIPESMDGQVITDIFQEAFLTEHPPRPGADLPTPHHAYDLDPDENAAINDRLRGLGYLG